MTHYQIQVKLTCPSDWKEADAQRYIERITPTTEERESIRITNLDEAIDEKQERLSVRAMDLASQCGRLTAVDKESTLFSREADVLSGISAYLTVAVDSGLIRLSTALDLMETLFELQQQSLTERKAEIAKQAHQ